MPVVDAVTATLATELPLFWGGLQVTVELLVVSSVIGILLAVPLALARLAESRLVSVPATLYTTFFRGTPLLVQIFLIYYGLPQFDAVRNSLVWPLLRDPMPCALLAFSLNMSAYSSEVIRGGIMGVPKGEREAAMACGMSHALVMRRVVLPRAFRIALPALSNEVILQMKATALASTVTLLDITGVGRRFEARTYTTEALYIAGSIYITLTFMLAQGFRLLESQLGTERRA